LPINTTPAPLYNLQSDYLATYSSGVSNRAPIREGTDMRVVLKEIVHFLNLIVVQNNVMHLHLSGFKVLQRKLRQPQLNLDTHCLWNLIDGQEVSLSQDGRFIVFAVFNLNVVHRGVDIWKSLLARGASRALTRLRINQIIS